MFYKRDLCIVCSAGGHLSEALAAVKKVEADMYFVTKQDRHVGDRLDAYDTFYVNDPHTSKVAYIINALISLVIFVRQRPRIILSTGSGIAIATCLIGKLMGSRVIYIESGSRVTSPSRTGKLMYKYADIFYVQWKPMLKYYPDALYEGRLI